MKKQTRQDGAARIAAGEYPLPHSHSTHEEDESNCVGRRILAARIRSLVRREVRKAVEAERGRCYAIVLNTPSSRMVEHHRHVDIMRAIDAGCSKTEKRGLTVKESSINVRGSVWKVRTYVPNMPVKATPKPAKRGERQ
jgi:hypothetical protein